MELAGRYAKLHPLVSIAAIAVIVASGVVTAAVLGWIPAARSERAETATAPLPAARAETPDAGMAESEARPATRESRPMQGRIVQEFASGCANCGVVETVRAIEVPGESTGLGAVAGGVAGAVVGSQLGKGNGRTALGVLGAVGGAYAGNAIERNSRTATRFRITVRMDDGSKRAVYSSARPAFGAGDKVRVVNGALAAQG